MKVANKIFSKLNSDMLLYPDVDSLTVITEMSISKGEKDNVITTGGAVVVTYQKIKDIYISDDNMLVIVLDGDTGMVVSRYNEDGTKIEKVKSDV